jgi:hypothetical protein
MLLHPPPITSSTEGNMGIQFEFVSPVAPQKHVSKQSKLDVIAEYVIVLPVSSIILKLKKQSLVKKLFEETYGDNVLPVVG